jgi:nucleotide-binding universal stress UspA family protein
MLKKLLVPLDGSALAETALPYALELGQKFGAEVLLMRVLPPLVTIPAEKESAFSRSNFLQEWEAEARDYLNQLQDKLSETHLKVYTELLEGGPIAEMILEEAAERKVDVIVMSTHGYSGNDRWVYGSVANKVLQQAPCPVFLIRSKQALRK